MSGPAKQTVEFEVRIAWWFTHFYMPGLMAVLAVATLINPQAQPNWERVDFWLDKAMTVRPVKKGRAIRG